MSKVTDYVDNLFFLMPRTDAAAEMRQKLMESAEDKYEALVSWGKNEDEALGIVVSEFGSMEEICAELGVMPIGMGADSREEQLARDYSFLNRRFSQGLGFGIILCVLGIVACILLEEMFFASDAISAGALLLLGGIGAAMITTASIQYARGKKLLQMGIPFGDDLRERKNAWVKKMEETLCGLIMLVATALFFIFGVAANAWHPAWVLFPLGGVLCGIVGILCEAVKKK